MGAQLDHAETQDDGTRHYHWEDGLSFPSVTTITDEDPSKKAAISGFEDSHPRPKEYMREQGLLGSAVHHRILNRSALRPLEPPNLNMGARYDGLETDIETCESLWRRALDRHPWLNPGDQPHIEKPVRNVEREYSGRFDLLTTSGYLVDLKVSKAVYDSHRMQLAAYYKALDTTDGIPTPSRAAVVVLHPHPENNPRLEPQVETFYPSDLEKWFDRFLNVRSIYRREHGE